MQIKFKFKEFEIFPWKKRCIRLRWDLSLSLSIASRLQSKDLGSNPSTVEILFQKIGNYKVVKILFPEKMIRDVLESHHFVKFGRKQ